MSFGESYQEMAASMSSLISEHADEASFLWLQRSSAVHAPNYAPQQFADLDEHLEAHIDGLRVADDEGWRLAEATLENEGPEDFFPAAVLALEAQDGRFDALIERAKGIPEVIPGLISALGWVDPKFLTRRVREMLESPLPFKQMLGIAACAVHRKDPGAWLERYLASPAQKVRIRALRAAGELGRKDLLPHILAALSDGKQEARFWSAWSGVILGNRDIALDALKAYALRAGVHQMPALQLTLMASDMDAGHELLQRLPRTPDTERLRIVGAGLSGNPHYVPWLIDRMEQASLARVAAEAFVTITGADFNLDQLETPPPDDFEDGPTDDPDDEDVEVPEDVALPWPDKERIKTWWGQHQSSLAGHPRLFLGKPPSMKHCLTVLKEGYQRQRVAAAHYLCLSRPGTVLFNTAAPAWRQEAALNSLEQHVLGMRPSE
jgi:uncharacterized protein (TIGR02270 family)